MKVITGFVKIIKTSLTSMGL